MNVAVLKSIPGVPVAGCATTVNPGVEESAGHNASSPAVPPVHMHSESCQLSLNLKSMVTYKHSRVCFLALWGEAGIGIL